MGRIHGRKARLYVALASGGTAEAIQFVRSFSFDRATDRQDVTAFGDTNKVYVAGLPDATGQWSGFYDDSTDQLYTAANDGVARKFYWYPSTDDITTYWFGTGFFDFSMEQSVDAASTVSGTWSAASDIIKVG